MKHSKIELDPAFVADLRRGRTLEYLSEKYGMTMSAANWRAHLARRGGLAPERTLEGLSVVKHLRRSGVVIGTMADSLDDLPLWMVNELKRRAEKEGTVANAVQAILVEHLTQRKDSTHGQPHAMQPPDHPVGGRITPRT